RQAPRHHTNHVWRGGCQLRDPVDQRVVQDHWTLTSALTIDAGARFDVAAFPSSLGIASRRESRRQASRGGGSPQLVIGGGRGLFADRLVLASIELALSAKQHRIVEEIGEGGPAIGGSVADVRGSAGEQDIRL